MRPTGLFLCSPFPNLRHRLLCRHAEEVVAPSIHQHIHCIRLPLHILLHILLRHPYSCCCCCKRNRQNRPILLRTGLAALRNRLNCTVLHYHSYTHAKKHRHRMRKRLGERRKSFRDSVWDVNSKRASREQDDAEENKTIRTSHANRLDTQRKRKTKHRLENTLCGTINMSTCLVA